MYGVLYAYVSDIMLGELSKIAARSVTPNPTDPRGLPSTSPWHGRRALFGAEPHWRFNRSSHQDRHNTTQWQYFSKLGKQVRRLSHPSF